MTARARRPANDQGAADGAGRTQPTVDTFLAAQTHPLAAEIREVRGIVLGLDPSIREAIKWNSVSFQNKNDFFATVNLRSHTTLQLLLYTGVKKKATAETGVPVRDPDHIIEKWLARDRCLVSLGVGPAFKARRTALVALVGAWIKFV